MLIVSAGLVFFNTNMAAAVACCTTLIFTWLRYGKPDVSMTYNAALAGLVGITAGCDAVILCRRCHHGHCVRPRHRAGRGIL